MDKVWLRNFVLSIVKPLKSGKILSQKSDTATANNLVPDGGADDSFRLTSPFGFISGIPKGVTTFYQQLFGSGFENILLAFLHKARPTPSTGQTILYSTDASGASIQVTISLNPDGTLTITAPTKVTVNSTEADVNAATINLNGNATISGNLSVTGTSTLTGQVTAGAGVTAAGTVTAPTVAAASVNASGGVSIAGIPFATHRHTNVATGTGTSGGPV